MNSSVTGFAVEEGKSATPSVLDPEGTIKIISCPVTFGTSFGTGKGLVTLIQDVQNADQWRIYNLFTTLWELKDFKWRDGDSRDFHGVPRGMMEEGMNWREWRDFKKDFRKADPAVLIVG